jgi:hypothetical protein
MKSPWYLKYKGINSDGANEWQIRAIYVLWIKLEYKIKDVMKQIAKLICWVIFLTLAPLAIICLLSAAYIGLLE